MYRPRVIPVLLLKNRGLVKTKRFRNPRYLGDPINAVKLFNDLCADELVFLDILATKEKRCVSLDFVKLVGDEANMPFAVGGGIQTIDQIRDLLNAGAEKVILNTSAVRFPQFIKTAADTFGSSTITVCIDVKKNVFGKKTVRYFNGKKSIRKSPVAFAIEMENLGVGELIVQSIDNDGMKNGYDLKLIEEIARAVSIPVVALAGAKNVNDFKEACTSAYASAVAAGSYFVYHGARNAVLINYPSKKELNSLFSNADL
jgi:cyclase